MIANETILQWTQNDTEMHTSLPTIKGPEI